MTASNPKQVMHYLIAQALGNSHSVPTVGPVGGAHEYRHPASPGNPSGVAKAKRAALKARNRRRSR